jgi:hypothetical protein
MPTYAFRDKDTGNVHEKFLSFSGRDEYLKQNPNLEITITQAPAFVGDHVSIKTDTGFKEVLQKIHEKTPGSVLNTLSSQI